MLQHRIKMYRPPFGLFPGLHVFPGGHLELNDRLMSNSKIESLKICAMRETLEETGVWPLSNHIKSFKTEPNNIKIFLNQNNIPLKELLTADIYPWMNWRTPDCKHIYPKRWDMQMFVMASESLSICPGFRSQEAEEIEWIPIEEVLNRYERDMVRLVPPQWYMIKLMSRMNESDFLESVKQSGNKFILPKLVSSKNSNIWHSILPGDSFYNRPDISVNNIECSNGPFLRIAMTYCEGVFRNFKLIENK